MKLAKTKLAVAAAAAFAICACSEERRMETADVAANAPSAEADNTERNVRDRDGATLTPLDQSDAPADVDLTQRIRQGITGNDAMSVQARNVKVIAQSGVVTLRGPVETQAEKDTIESVAKSAGATRIDNQLEIDRDDAPGQE